MAELAIVGIIIVILGLYLLFMFFNLTSLFINLIVIITLIFLIKKDLKSKYNQKYYLSSLFLTSFFFIFSTTGFIANILSFGELLSLSLLTIALMLLFLLARLVAFTYEFYQHIKSEKEVSK
jgi:hypothetical protein